MDSNEEVKTIGKIILYKNALIFGNTTYQISNICSLWIADHSYTIKHKFPTWILIAAIAGFLILIIPFQLAFLWKAVLAVVFFGAAIYGFKAHNPETSIAKYALGIELNSGRKSLFTAPDHAFVQQAAKALTEAMAEKQTAPQKVVMNFDNRSISVENAINSNIVGGDVKDTLVESI